MTTRNDDPKDFTIFRKWMNCFDMLKDEIGSEAAYSLFEAIADYSMYDITTDFSCSNDAMKQLVLQSTFEAMCLSIDLAREKSPQKPEAPDGARGLDIH